MMAPGQGTRRSNTFDGQAQVASANEALRHFFGTRPKRLKVSVPSGAGGAPATAPPTLSPREVRWHEALDQAAVRDGVPLDGDEAMGWESPPLSTADSGLDSAQAPRGGPGDLKTSCQAPARPPGHLPANNSNPAQASPREATASTAAAAVHPEPTPTVTMTAQAALPAAQQEADQEAGPNPKPVPEAAKADAASRKRDEMTSDSLPSPAPTDRPSSSGLTNGSTPNTGPASLAHPDDDNDDDVEEVEEVVGVPTPQEGTDLAAVEPPGWHLARPQLPGPGASSETNIPQPPPRTAEQHQAHVKEQQRRLLERIRNQLEFLGGKTAMDAAEVRRFEFLESACVEADLFALIVHQLFSVWSFRERERPKMVRFLAMPALQLNGVFETLLQVIGPPDLVSMASVQFFVEFPYPSVDHMAHRPPPAWAQIRDFFSALVSGWSTIAAAIRERGSPVSANELRHVLMLPSRLLQEAFFGLSIRTLGWDALDEPARQEMARLFREDQSNRHQTPMQVRVLPARYLWILHRSRLVSRAAAETTVAADSSPALNAASPSVLTQFDPFYGHRRSSVASTSSQGTHGQGGVQTSVQVQAQGQQQGQGQTPAHVRARIQSQTPYHSHPPTPNPQQPQANFGPLPLTSPASTGFPASIQADPVQGHYQSATPQVGAMGAMGATMHGNPLGAAAANDQAQGGYLAALVQQERLLRQQLLYQQAQAQQQQEMQHQAIQQQLLQVQQVLQYQLLMRQQQQQQPPQQPQQYQQQQHFQYAQQPHNQLHQQLQQLQQQQQQQLQQLQPLQQQQHQQHGQPGQHGWIANQFSMPNPQQSTPILTPMPQPAPVRQMPTPTPTAHPQPQQKAKKRPSGRPRVLSGVPQTTTAFSPTQQIPAVSGQGMFGGIQQQQQQLPQEQHQQQQPRPHRPPQHITPQLQTSAQVPTPVSAQGPVAGDVPFWAGVGVTLRRNQIPNQHDRACLQGTLHLSEVRSPPRRPLSTPPPGSKRFVQYVSRLEMGPVAVGPSHYVRNFDFHLSTDRFGKLQQRSDDDGRAEAEARYFEGSLRFWFRLCKAGGSREACADPPAESKWVMMPSQWPEHLFVMVNSKHVQLRRKGLWGKDLPVDMTAYLVEGANQVKVMWPEGPGAADAGTWFASMEEVVAMPQEAVFKAVTDDNARITAAEAKANIWKRLGDTDDDDLVVEPRSIFVKVTDPFSFGMCQTPVRGADCAHLECFDLAIWLETREGKPARVPPGGRSVEPSVADKWACPVCSADARPPSLRVDEFMDGVCRELRARGLGGVKQILLAPDATWTAEEEAESEGEDEPQSPELRQPRPQPRQQLRQQQQSRQQQQQPRQQLRQQQQRQNRRPNGAPRQTTTPMPPRRQFSNTADDPLVIDD